MHPFLCTVAVCWTNGCICVTVTMTEIWAVSLLPSGFTVHPRLWCHLRSPILVFLPLSQCHINISHYVHFWICLFNCFILILTLLILMFNNVIINFMCLFIISNRDKLHYHLHAVQGRLFKPTYTDDKGIHFAHIISNILI